jgi:hypothetical protein
MNIQPAAGVQAAKLTRRPMRKHDATNCDYLWIPKDELRAELRKFLSTEMEKRDRVWNKILHDALSVFIEMLALYNREAANRMAKTLKCGSF